jgi:putative oxidoreductase
MSLALLVPRAVIGVLFYCHGAQKLFGQFGGGGIDATAGAFDKMGLRPGRRNAIAAGAAELVGGAMLGLGLFTPVAAAVLIAVMTAAVLTVHLANGPWATDNGYEYNLVLAAVVFGYAGFGPGAWSFDDVLGLGTTGAAWALGALVVGLIGGYGAVVAGRRHGVQRDRTRATQAVPGSSA